MQIETIRQTLAQYGDNKNLTSGFQITRDSKPCGIFIVIKKGRIRFEDEDKRLIMSGPVKPETIENFVEKYWFWSK